MGTDEAGLIQRALGVLEGTVRSLMDQWRTQEAEAARLRHLNNQTLETLTRQVDRLSTDVQGVQQDVAELKNDYEDKIYPALQKVEDERNQKIGQRTVWALVYTGIIAVLGAILGAVGFLADKLFKHFFP